MILEKLMLKHKFLFRDLVKRVYLIVTPFKNLQKNKSKTFKLLLEEPLRDWPQPLPIPGYTGLRYQVRLSCHLAFGNPLVLFDYLGVYSHSNSPPVVLEMRDLASPSMFTLFDDLDYVLHSSLLVNPSVALPFM